MKGYFYTVRQCRVIQTLLINLEIITPEYENINNYIHELKGGNYVFSD